MDMRPILSVENLSISFGDNRNSYEVVSDVSFKLCAGNALGLVGESGCGKSITGLSIMGLVPPPGRVTGGAIIFRDEDIVTAEPWRLRQIRGAAVSMVFQDHSNTLNPVITIGGQLIEQLRSHRPSLSRRQARDIAAEALARVGMSDATARLSSYPHELSGGMRQRIIIAAAMLLSPQIIIADEPTTALDVTVQAQILELIRSLKEEPYGTSIMLISHDIGVIAQLCERMIVMYAGTMVETGPTAQILSEPMHPYTVGLLDAIPSVRTQRRKLASIPGTLPNPATRLGGCAFRDRCSMAVPECWVRRPPLSATGGQRMVACHVIARR